MRKVFHSILCITLSLALLMTGLSVVPVGAEETDAYSTGDVDNNNAINAMDATRILLFAVGNIDLSYLALMAADVNEDGSLNALDATLVLLHCVDKRPLEIKEFLGDDHPDKYSGSANPAFSELIWSDEFDGDALDLTKWDYQLGTHDAATNGPANWGNDERQYYIKDAVEVKDGFLSITAKFLNEEQRAEYEGMDYRVCYTSGRIRTRNDAGTNLFSTTYGRIEARISLPTGADYWPAFWMLPGNNKYGGWASSGELDIMEADGSIPTLAMGTMHYGGSQGNGYANQGGKYMMEDSDISEFHVYAIEWEPTQIRWYVDDVMYHSVNSEGWYSNADRSNPLAPFDTDFYLILNLAVCGTLVGYSGPLANAEPQSMMVDYVRVFGYDPE